MESNPTQVEIIRSTLREKSKAKIDNLQRKAVLARDRFKSKSKMLSVQVLYFKYRKKIVGRVFLLLL